MFSVKCFLRILVANYIYRKWEPYECHKTWVIFVSGSDRLSVSDHLGYRPRYAHLPAMDFETFFNVLSSLLAILLPILLALILYTLFFTPDYVKAEFRAPKGYRESGTRIILILERPCSLDLALLLGVFTLDIILVYPFTATGSQADIYLLAKVGSIVILGIQLAAAVGWWGIQTDWLSAGRNFGLWKKPIWAVYYMVFILTTLACVLPLILMGIHRGAGFVISQTPNVWMAFYNAFKSLIPESETDWSPLFE
jgi:hypothetical protein